MTGRWKVARVADDGTHHVLGAEPLYPARFLEVLSFHEPGLAAARDASGSFHIRVDGEGAYRRRFSRTFGFYEGRAAVVDESGAHHVDEAGRDVGTRRFEWCGNFQLGACTVRDPAGHYFHVGLDDEPRYSRRWTYAGDFREGSAVVREETGLHHHIDLDGRDLGLGEFVDLDVFHKGFARARDRAGWFHLRRDGSAAYAQRYAAIEPFYNGQSRCTDERGRTLVIDEGGRETVLLRALTDAPVKLVP